MSAGLLLGLGLTLGFAALWAAVKLAEANSAVDRTIAAALTGQDDADE